MAQERVRSRRRPREFSGNGRSLALKSKLGQSGAPSLELPTQSEPAMIDSVWLAPCQTLALGARATQGERLEPNRADGRNNEC